MGVFVREDIFDHRIQGIFPFLSGLRVIGRTEATLMQYGATPRLLGWWHLWKLHLPYFEGAG